MAYLSINEFPGTGAIMQVEINFAGNRPDAGSGVPPYFNVADVKALRVVPPTTSSVGSQTAVTLTAVNANTFRTAVVIPVGQTLRVYRESQDEYALVDFQALQLVTEDNLDTLSRQTLFISMEAKDAASLAGVSAQTAISLAVSANTTSASAVSTANAAVVTANSAVSAATTANAKSDAAVATANSAVNVANLANIASAAAVDAAAEAIEKVDGVVADSTAAVKAATDRFLPPAASNPGTRADGSPLQEGDRYLNTQSGVEYIYNDGAWAANNLDGSAIANPTDPSQGAALVGFDGEDVASQLNAARTLSYSELLAYNGSASRATVTTPGVSGTFVKRAMVGTETAVAGMKVIRGSSVWERDYTGPVQASWFGVGNDSVGRYAVQLQAAINYVASLGTKLEVSGNVYLEAGIVFPSTAKYHADFSKAKLIFDASISPAVTIGTVGSNPYRGTLDGLSISKVAAGASDVGVLLLNCVENALNDPIVNNFATAMLLAPANSSRVAYCSVYNPTFSNHIYGIRAVPADSTSYVNENTFIGGRLGSFIAGRLADHIYLDNSAGSGVQHNRFIGLSIEGFSSSGSSGKSAARCVSGANQNIFEWCRTEKYNSGWDDGTYVLDASTSGNVIHDTRADTIINDAGSNNWWTPANGTKFVDDGSSVAAVPVMQAVRRRPLSSVGSKFAIDVNDIYSASGEAGFLKYTSARGNGDMISLSTPLGTLKLNGACEWTTPSARSGATSGAAGHGYTVAASVTGATFCAAYHSAKATGWAFYGEGTAPSYLGGLLRTNNALSVTPSTAVIGMLAFSNTSTNTGAVAAEYNTNNVAARHHVSFSNPNGVVGSISTTASATAYNTASDKRLKTNIQDAKSSGAVVDGIRVREFDWRSGGHQNYGFIAQELHKVAPEAVTTGGEDGYWSVDYSKLVPLLVKEIQELRLRVANVERKEQ